MTASKTNKSYKKRLKVTPLGKVIKRRPGQNHFRSKKSRRYEMDHARTEEFEVKKKKLSGYLPHEKIK